MSNLFKGLKPDVKLSRNGFDLSQKHVFSTKAGMAVPCLALECVPNDYHEIDLLGLHRTMTLNTAAFVRGKFRYDFYFVPNSQLWHPFNQFISQRTDKHSSRQRGHVVCPTLSLSALLQLIRDDSTSIDIHGVRWQAGAVRLLDMLGYGNYQAIIARDSNDDYVMSDAEFSVYKANFSTKYINIFRLAAYQHVFYDIYRNKYYDVADEFTTDTTGQFSDYVQLFNFDDLECVSVATSRLPISSDAEKNRVRGLLTLRYVQWSKDLFTSVLPGQQFGSVSSVDIQNLGLLINSMSVKGTGGKIGSANVSWSDTINANTDYNLKYKSEVGHQPDENTNLTFRRSGSEEGYASAGTFQGQPNNLMHRHSISNIELSHNIDADVNSVNGTLNGLSISANYPGSVGFNVLSLRKAEMLQAWKQATLRAGNMTDDSFKAHYGVEPYYDADENVHFLGSVDCQLNINAIEATAATGESVNGNVGDIAATGTSVINGNKIKFECRDFGIILCICSFTPQAEYPSDMIDKANTLYEQFDYFTPEFQNIGLEAVGKEFYKFSSIEANVYPNVMGYAPRYWMYKTALDKVHGEFATKMYKDSDGNLTKVLRGSLTPWVAPRYETTGSNETATGRSLSTFYVSPRVMNNVFAISANANQNTDTFLHNVYFDIKSIRPMSVLGLPQF